jgi:glycerol-3-phosphate dehydrogenase (NAD+)
MHQTKLPYGMVCAQSILPHDVPIISVSKGLEVGTGKMMSEVIPDALGRRQPAAFLSGPSFAKEIMDLRPTGVVAASKVCMRSIQHLLLLRVPSSAKKTWKLMLSMLSFHRSAAFCRWWLRLMRMLQLPIQDKKLAREMQSLFASPYLRVNTTTDVTGVEICGALKNVLALAAGIVEGLELGNNAMAALVAQGCAEIRWLAEKMGAKSATVSGLSGLGDIMLTCYGSLSRNRCEQAET